MHLIHCYRTVGMLGYRRYQECTVCGKRKYRGGPGWRSNGQMPVDHDWLEHKADNLNRPFLPPRLTPQTGSRGVQPIGEVKPIPPPGALEEVRGIYRSPKPDPRHHSGNHNTRPIGTLGSRPEPNGRTVAMRPVPLPEDHKLQERSNQGYPASSALKPTAG